MWYQRLQAWSIYVILKGDRIEWETAAQLDKKPFFYPFDKLGPLIAGHNI